MGDRIIITEDEPKPEPALVVVKETPQPEIEKVVTEKTTVIEKRST